MGHLLGREAAASGFLNDRDLNFQPLASPSWNIFIRSITSLPISDVCVSGVTLEVMLPNSQGVLVNVSCVISGGKVLCPCPWCKCPHADFKRPT